MQIGPGRALDPGKYFIIATDAIANGLTTSPSNSKAQPRMQFPRFNMRDIVNSTQRLVTEKLGIKKLVTVAGAPGVVDWHHRDAAPDDHDRSRLERRQLQLATGARHAALGRLALGDHRAHSPVSRGPVPQQHGRDRAPENDLQNAEIARFLDLVTQRGKLMQ